MWSSTITIICFWKVYQQDDEETFGQIDEDSEDQISNNDVGEEVHANNN